MEIGRNPSAAVVKVEKFLSGGDLASFPEKAGSGKGSTAQTQAGAENNRKPVISRSPVGKIRQDPRCWKFTLRPEWGE